MVECIIVCTDAQFQRARALCVSVQDRVLILAASSFHDSFKMASLSEAATKKVGAAAVSLYHEFITHPEKLAPIDEPRPHVKSRDGIVTRGQDLVDSNAPVNDCRRLCAVPFFAYASV